MPCLLSKGSVLTPDKRRGKVTLQISQDDGLLHVKWSVRPGGQEEMDLNVMPKDAVFVRLPGSVTTAHDVYAARLVTSLSFALLSTL